VTDSPVESVLFDLDDTLVRYGRSTATVLSEAFEACGVDPLFPVDAYYDRFDEFADWDTPMAELRRNCFAAICEARGHDPDVGRRVADAFAASRDHRNVELFPEAERVLRTFADRYRVGIVTNGPKDAQSQKVDASGVGNIVETVVYAAHETEPKPDPEPFRVALDRLDTPPERAVHVGNSVNSDVRGAAAAGLRSVWIPASPPDADAATAGADYRLDALAGLLPPPW
jgi:putative hydrolase of the HAD superfamily